MRTLLTSYPYREATTEQTGTGFAIECTGTSATLWNETTGWFFLDGNPASAQTVLEVLPTHTDKTFRFDRRIQTLETIRDQATDIYEEQRAVEELAKLRKKPVTVSKIGAQVQELRTQITELQAADQIKYEEKVAAAQLKVETSRSPALELTGLVTFVVLENP